MQIVITKWIQGDKANNIYITLVEKVEKVYFALDWPTADLLCLQSLFFASWFTYCIMKGS